MASTPPKVDTSEDDPRYRPCHKCGLCDTMDGDDTHCGHKQLPKKPKGVT